VNARSVHEDGGDDEAANRGAHSGSRDGDKRRARGNGDLHDTDLTNEKIEQTT